MERVRKFLRSPVFSVILFVIAASLLLTGTIGGTRAMLTYISDDYITRMNLQEIGVSLVENGTAVSFRDYDAEGVWNEGTGVLLANMLPEGEALKLGRVYDELLTVSNSGNIDEYVRVSLYKYWLDRDGNKLTTLSPSLIDLHLVNLDNGWLLDENASTEERTVLYYDSLLVPGQESVPFADRLIISPEVASTVTQETYVQDGYTVITTTYDYNGVSFQIEARVDAVQTHSVEKAILSAWGRGVTVADGVLSLNGGEGA